MLPSQAKAFLFVFGLLSILGMSPPITPFSNAMAQDRSEAFKEYAINARQKFEKHNTKLFLFNSKKNNDIVQLPEIEGLCFFKGCMAIAVNATPGTIPFDLLSTVSSIDEVPQLATDNNADNMVLGILNKSYHATIYAKQKEFSVLSECSSEIASRKHVFMGGVAFLPLSVPIFGIELWNVLNISGVRIVEPEQRFEAELSELEGFSILGLVSDPNRGINLWFCRDSKRLEYVTSKDASNLEVYIDFVYDNPDSVIPTRIEFGQVGADAAFIVKINEVDAPFVVSDDKFYLSGYGLPEPDWYKPPKPWWFYTSIVGMVLVVVGAVVFHFGKRLWREGAAKQNNKNRR